jgi:KDO2-lipid IV(A) lauroyltransferase
MRFLTACKNYSLLGLLGICAFLPYSWLIQIGHGLGWCASKIPNKRKRVIETNLRLCFPELTHKERANLAKKHWQLLGRSFLERGKFWLRGQKTIRKLVTIHPNTNLNDGKQRLYLNMHFIGLEAGLIAAESYIKDIEGPKTYSLYTPFKNKFFEARIKKWRERFGAQMLPRQQSMRQIIRIIRSGGIMNIAPDMDLGKQDSVFAPFFGISTCTVSSIARLAQIANVEVCPIITTLRADASGYDCFIGPTWSDFPTGNAIADATRMNAFFETWIKPRIGEYWWVHKRFKSRPAEEPSFYNF